MELPLEEAAALSKILSVTCQSKSTTPFSKGRNIGRNANPATTGELPATTGELPATTDGVKTCCITKQQLRQNHPYPSGPNASGQKQSGSNTSGPNQWGQVQSGTQPMCFKSIGQTSRCRHLMIIFESRTRQIISWLHKNNYYDVSCDSLYRTTLAVGNVQQNRNSDHCGFG